MDPDRSVSVTIRLPPRLVQRLDEIARAGHRSRNRQVQRFVEQALGDLVEASRAK